MDNKDIKVIKSEELSSAFDNRFIIININTGEILDDAQGYGYKTIEKAFAAFYYKKNNKKSDAKKKKALKKRLKDGSIKMKILKMILNIG